MSKYAKFKSNGSLLDLFLLLALGFVVLFILAFILIKPVDPKNKDIELEEQLLIKLTWLDTAPNDLDLWLQTPDGELVSFRKKEHAGAVLERDDLGDDKDWVVIDGELQPLFTNSELCVSNDWLTVCITLQCNTTTWGQVTTAWPTALS